MVVFGRKRPNRIELHKSSDGWRYRVRARNGKIVAASEEGLKQYSYAKNRAIKQFPGCDVVKIDEQGVAHPVEV